MAMHIEKTNFGNVEITQIVEQSISDLMGALLPDATPEAVAEIDWLKPPYFLNNHNFYGRLPGCLKHSA